MGRISIETRKHIIDLFESGYKPRAIIEKLPTKIAISSVYYIIKKYRSTKTVQNKSFKSKRKLNAAVIEFIGRICDEDR